MGARLCSDRNSGRYRPEAPKKVGKGHESSEPPKQIVGAEVPLKFRVQFDTIKARNIPTDACYFRIIFAGEKTLTTQRETLYSPNHNWVYKEEFEYNTTRGALREKAIELILIDGYDQEIGHVGVNLHEIATGPTEHDFPVQLKKSQKEVARINFTIKMFQIIRMSIKTKKVLCKLNEGLKEKNYNFSLKLKTKGREFLSEHSNNFRNQTIPLLPEKTQDLNDFENYQQGMDEENKQINLRHVTPNAMTRTDYKVGEKLVERSQIETVETSIVQENPSFASSVDKKSSVSTMKEKGKLISQPTTNLKKDVLWDYPENSDNSSAPVIEMDVSIKELATGSFQFFLWTNKEGPGAAAGMNDSQLSGDEVYIDHKLLAECYIGMTKFFFGQAEINFGEDNTGVPGLPMEAQSITFNATQKRIAKFNEKLWFHGAGIGDLVGEFILENTGFYKQMIYGVRTEEGVQKVGSVYANKDASGLGLVKTADIKEIKALEVYKDSLKSMLTSLTNPKLVPRARNAILSDMKDTQYKMLETLKTLNQDVMLAFAYKTPDSLLSSQRILLDVSKSLLETLEQMPVNIRPLSYENLAFLSNRPEFELNSMGFSEAYVDFMKNPQKQGTGAQKLDQKILQKKMEICLEYQTLLYHLLQRTIGKSNEKGIPEKEREFVELFNAQAYFRIPEFRTKLLECFLKEDEKVPINEWRGTDWVLDDRTNDQKRNQYFVSLFDWDKEFYTHINGTEQGRKNKELLNSILNDPEWQAKMSKKGVAFYLYLTDWAKQVDRTIIIKDNVPWPDIPGYITLIKSFFIDLKTKDVRYYPESLIQASCSLLRNEKLLNTFVSIAYKKTSLYDSSSVFAVYELVNKWFGFIIENNKSIPSTFDFGFFFKGLYMVLEGEHALNVALALLVIYNNFNLFPYSEKQQLSEYLFSKLFFKLFLHWSWIVRQVFHHLLLYRFYHQHRYTNTNLKDPEDLKKELLRYNQQREAHKKDQKLLINDFINMEYARNMTIIENAYNKFTEEKRREAYQRKLPTKMKPLPKLKYASSVNLRSFLEPEDLKPDGSLTPASSVHRNFTPTYPEPEGKQRLISYGGIQDKKAVLGANVDPSCWVINPDRLDVGVAPHGGKQEMIKPSRSESVSHGLKSVLEEEPPSGATTNAKLAVKEPKANEGPSAQYERVNDKKKVIHRKVMYFDKQTNEMKEIPKEYLVYLQASYQEFEKTKEQYLKWLNQGAARGKEEDKTGKTTQKVPELIVKIPLDDLEGGQGPIKEW